MNFKKIKSDYRQYKFGGFLIRIIKFVLRKIGIKYDSYYYMVNEIDYEKQKAIWNDDQSMDVSEMSYIDFNKGDKSVFTESKIIFLRSLLNEKNCLAYGIFENNRLIFSCMLSIQDFVSPSPSVKYKLNTDECLMLDAYCIPEARGRGIHKKMCAYRLLRAYELGKKKSITVVLKENIASLKSLQQVGYTIAFKYYVIQIGTSVYTNFYKNKKC